MSFENKPRPIDEPLKRKRMIQKTNYTTKARVPGAATADKPKVRRNSSRLYTSTVEYTMIANLVTQQYQQDKAVRFDALLSIPVEDRIPGLIERYGNKTMYRLLVMILKEFFASLPLPRYKKPTETKTSVTACQLMLTSYEDHLALEDVILFLQRVKAGVYGTIKNLSDPMIMFTLLEIYRKARHEAYAKIKAEKEAALKALGPLARIAPEPTSVNELMKQGLLIDMNNQKMSG
jgi:hypothetical protein